VRGAALKEGRARRARPIMLYQMPCWFMPGGKTISTSPVKRPLYGGYIPFGWCRNIACL